MAKSKSLKFIKYKKKNKQSKKSAVSSKQNISSDITANKKISTSSFFEEQLNQLKERHKHNKRLISKTISIAPPTFSIPVKNNIEFDITDVDLSSIPVNSLILEESTVTKSISDSALDYSNKKFCSNSTLETYDFAEKINFKKNDKSIIVSNPFSCLEVDDEADDLVDTGDNRGTVPKRLLMNIHHSALSNLCNRPSTSNQPEFLSAKEAEEWEEL